MTLQASAMPSRPAPECYRFGPFTLDLDAHKLWRAGEELGLPSRAFDTLVHLVRHRDRIVDKDELIRTVWEGTFVSDDSLIHCISVLRRVLHDEVEHPKLIATLPRRGYRFIGEVADAPSIDTPREPVAVSQPSPKTAARKPLPRWWGAASVVGTLAIGFAVVAIVKWILGNSPVQMPFGPVLLAQAPSPGTTLASGGVLSPGGRRLAFVARDQITGTSRIWVRSIDSRDVHAVNGTEDASKPFWSPDGEQIGFFAGGKLRIVTVPGGTPRTIASLSVSPTGGSWSTDDVIVFGDFRTGLSAVNAQGGAVTPLTTPDTWHDIAHAWPHFLPDGRHFLYTVTSWNAARTGIWVGSIADRDEPRRLVSSPSPGVFSTPGYLLYVSDDTLVAASFDARRLRIDGDPIVLFRNIPAPTLTGDDVFSVAGTLLSFRGGSKSERLVWFSRDGRRIGAVETPTPLYNPMVSPDGTQLVATGSPVQHSGLWMVDLKGSASTRLATEGIGALWSPDGKRVAFTTRGGLSIKINATAGRVEETLLLSDNDRKTLQDWSPDGRYLVYTHMSTETKIDLWLLPVSDPRHATALLHTTANERGARISPDGRWIAYTSDETGRSEVYVQEFPGLGSKRAVSTGGGAGPSWRQDGSELFYLSPTLTLMAVDVHLGATISLGSPRPLFRAPVSGESSEARNHYAVGADGQKFLINVIEESAERGAITVVVNWAAGLKPATTAASRNIHLDASSGN